MPIDRFLRSLAQDFGSRSIGVILSGTGTVRFYGCSAEEGGRGKTFMVRADLFDDCDAALHWHPSGATRRAIPRV